MIDQRDKEMENESVKFLKAIYSNCETGLINFRFLPNERNEFLSVNEMFKTPRLISKYNGANIYYAVALRKSNDGTKQGISLNPAVWLEHDNFNSDIKAKINSFLQPSIEVQSSRPEKAHLYWLLKEPASYKENSLIEDINKRLANYFSGDSNACDASRILRLPGTLNHKYTPPLPCKIISLRPECQYNLQDFEILPKIETTSKSTDQKQGQSNYDVGTPPRGVKVCFWKALNEGVEAANPGRHVWALRISKYLQRDQGLSPDIARAALIQWNLKNKPPLSEKEFNLNRTIADGVKYDWGCNDAVLKTLCSPQCHLYKKDQSILELCSEDVIEFIDRKIENPQPLIEGGILPQRGQLIIGGSSKRGKSVLADNLALDLVTATPFLGQFAIPKKRRGSIFQAEISEVSMQDRLQKMVRAMPIKPEPGFLEVINKKGLNLNRTKDFDLIRGKIENHQSEFVMIDPMYRFHSGDENKSSEMKNFFSQTDQLTEKCGVAVILVHHFGKPTEFEREGAQMLRGSSTIFDYGDSYLSLKRQSRNKPKEYITIAFELRNAEDPDSLYLWRNPETLWYEVQAVDSTSTVTDHDIISLIQSVNGEVMRSDLIKMIVDTFRVSEITAGRTMRTRKAPPYRRESQGQGKPNKDKT